MCLFFGIPWLIRKCRGDDKDDEEQAQQQPARPAPAYGDKTGQQQAYAMNQPAPQYQQHLGGQYGGQQNGGQPPQR